MNIKAIAKNPPRRNRPVPFWSWNDKLEAQECRTQIQEMYGQGMGGYFMHARGGLQTEYLSKEWFDVTRASIDEGKRLGMRPWAYDENGWPSGFGGGAVCGMGLEYQQKYLRFRKRSEMGELTNVIAVYDADGRPLPEISQCPQDGFAAYYEVNPYYVDTLDGKVIAQFLNTIYQCYYDNLSEEERSCMEGFFTDEPQISRNGIPWSFILEAEYRQDWQEELLTVLPGLFRDDAENARRTRARFWRTITRLFSENFCRQIYLWCHAHGWKLTGHLVLEETLLWQLFSNGACMPHYEYFDIPGMDMLGRYLTTLLAPLQLFSAAAQTGHSQVLSETFALCGWAVDFTDLRWLYQWQMVHGVNLLCQHLEGYSLRGIRKRDYPASHFRHQPWWEYDHLFVDYVSRIGTLLESGKVEYEVLLLHPQSSAHLNYNDQDNGKLAEYDSAFLECTKALEAAQINHHYGDETLMARHGSVRDGRLVIGNQSYSTVIVPKLCELSANQIELLTAFVKAGGVILGIENDIEAGAFAVDGVECPAHPILASIRWFKSIGELIAAHPELALLSVRTPEGGACPDINVTSRGFADFDGKGARLYYLVNNDRHAGCAAVIEIAAAGLEKYDPVTGEVVPVEFTVRDGKCLVRHDFSIAGDLLLLARDYAVEAAPTPLPAAAKLPLTGTWKLKKHSGNLLTLDYCRCFADGEEAFANEYILSIHDWLLTKERDVPVALEFEFSISDEAAAGIPMELLIERPERYVITLNGRPVNNASLGFFADPAFQRVSIAGMTVPGRNVIRLETIFRQSPEIYANIRAAKIFETEKNKLCYDSELEAIYIFGNFGVRGTDQGEILPDGCLRHRTFEITACPEVVNGENICLTGMPFFSGKLTMTQEVVLNAEETSQRRCVEFEQLRGSVLNVKVNGFDCGVCIYPPFRCDIPQGVLKAGGNLVEVTVATSLRNMLGPHHLDMGECVEVGPPHFYKELGPFRTGDWPPMGSWNDGYAFLPVGVKF